MGSSFHDWLDEQFWWWPISARWEGLTHLFRGHSVRWFANTELWVGCLGDIVCDTCDLGIWCRFSPKLMQLAQKICAWLGHPSTSNPSKLIDWDAIDKPIREPVLNKWSCDRCAADVEKV